jgi:hypothetical protein
MGTGRGGVAWLEKVPLVAVEVFEYGDGAVGLLARLLEEFDVGGEHEAVISPEIVGVKEEEDTACGLLADLVELFGSRGLCEEQIRAARAGRSYNEPAFVAGQWRVFDDAEAKRFSEEGQGFVIIANEEGYVSKRLRHERLSH